MKSITEIGLQEPVRGSAKEREQRRSRPWCMWRPPGWPGIHNIDVYAALCCLQIDVLLVEGQYYGFSGCHRFEAHQRLGLPTIKCRVRKANKQVLKMHMM